MPDQETSYNRLQQEVAQLRRQVLELESRLAFRPGTAGRCQACDPSVPAAASAVADTGAEDALKTLMAWISHKMNNALSAINGNLLLLKMVHPQDEHLIKYSGRMQSSADRMNRLADRLAAYSEGRPHAPGPICVQEFVDQNLPAWQNKICTGRTLKLDIGPDVARVHADCLQLELALGCLLERSVSCLHPGEGLDLEFCRQRIDSQTAERFDCDPAADYVCLTIRALAAGNETSIRADLSRRVPNPMTLAAAHHIIRNHGGWLEFSPLPGAGRLARCCLPAAQLNNQ